MAGAMQSAKGLLGLILVAMAAWLPGAALAADLVVDCGKAAGEIRPLHGGNGGPLNYGETIDLTEYHKALAIPYTRLHDCGWPCGNVVDIHAIFPDLKADPARAESYDFRRTDDYIAAIVKAGSAIVYRLGESIEHSKRKHCVHPPADYEKWAAVCAGIVRHYNFGWAGGFRYNIRYWEIWNEPENRPQMWSGSDEDYYRLYGVTAKALKARWPDLKVGGPAVGWSGEVVGETLKATPFLKGFLEYCERESAPLDFFSWHIYTNDPAAVAARAKAVRRCLDESGFAGTESHLNEWNFLPNNDWGPMIGRDGKVRQAWYEDLGGPQGAAFTASVLLMLQDSPVAVANYYSADTGGFGLFNWYGAPRKTFYAFKAFKALLDTPLRVEAAGGDAGRMAACAGMARDKASAAILIANYRSSQDKLDVTAKNLPWDGQTAYEFFIVDGQRDLEKVRTGVLPSGNFKLPVDLKAPAVGLVTLRKSTANK
jgi:hypothetical protein